MEPETKKFGRGARELNGAVDLISHYKLDPQHEFFCRRPLPGPISETHYLHNVPGDTEIRRGAGMELDQLFNPNLIPPSFPPPSIHSFNIDSLRHAFSFRDAAPVCLPPVERGAPTISGSVKQEPKEKSLKQKKRRDKEQEHKNKEHKKHKHRHKDRSKDRDKDKDRKRDKDRDKKDKKRKRDSSENLADSREYKKSKAESIKGQR